MILGSTQNVTDLLLHIQAKGSTAQTALPETPFKDLLEGSLQQTGQTSTEPKQTEPAPVTEEPQQEPARQPEQSEPEQTGQVAPEKPQQAPQEPDSETAALAVAAMIAPAVIAAPEQPVAEEMVLPVQAASPQTQPAIPLPVQQQAPVVAPDAQAPVPQEAQQPEAQPQAGETQAQTQTQTPQVEILSAQLTVTEPEQSEQIQKGDQRLEEPARQPMDEAQQRFDTMLAKASRELTDTPARQEPVETQTQEPAAQTVETAEPRQEAAQTQRPKEEPKAELTEAKTVEEPAPQPREVQQTQAPRQASQPTPAQQIQAQVIENLEQEKMEFRMQLAPKELGKVDVRMLMEGGKLTVEIVAASSKAVQELQRTSEGLLSSLRTANVQLESIQIVHQPQTAEDHMDGAFNMLNGRQQPQDEQQGGHSRHGGADSGDFDPEDEPAGDLSRLLDAAV